MAKNVFRTQLIELVQEGMDVYDAKGDKLGSVELVKMGDPEAMTTRGEEPTPQAGVMPLTNESDEPQVPEPIRSDLVRAGFVKIDGPGILDTDRYVRADTIDRIDGDKVYLRLPDERIPKEGDDDLEYEVQPDASVRPGTRKTRMPPAAIGLGLPNQMQ